MAKPKGKKKPPKAVGNRVPNPSNATLGGKVKQALLAGVMARVAYPAIAHTLSLPTRLGIGFDDQEMIKPSSNRTTSSRKGLQLAVPPHLQTPAIPPEKRWMATKSAPSRLEIPKYAVQAVQKSKIKAPPIASQVPPSPPEPKSEKSSTPSLGKALGKAALYGIAGHAIAGPITGIPAAIVGAIKGSKPEGVSTMSHLGNSLYGLGKMGVNGVVGAAKSLGRSHGIQSIGRAVDSLPEMPSFGDIGRSVGKGVVKGAKYMKEGFQDILNNRGFDNEAALTPSHTRRTTNTLSPGRALMTSLRAANEQRQPEPNVTNNHIRKAAIEALKKNNDNIATVLGLVEPGLEQVAQPQAVGQANGVALPSPGPIAKSMTRRNRADTGKMRASMDQLNNLSQGQTPQNPIGMEADEQLAMVPSSHRATPLPLSKGQEVMKRIRENNALKERMARAASYDGEHADGENIGMTNVVTCDICCCSPCCCTKPSSQRVNSPGRKVMAELHQQKVVRQKMEPVINPMPVPSTKQDVI